MSAARGPASELLRAYFHLWRLRVARGSLQVSAKLATAAARLLKQ